MVEPISYNSAWQKFENDVYEAVKKYFSEFRPDFRVEWNYHIRDINPDVVIVGECQCGAVPDFCEIPQVIFEACHMFEFSGQKWKEKDEQMKRYSRTCPSVLVTPRGYGQRAYCQSTNDEYRILSFQYLDMYLKCLRKNILVSFEDDVCGAILGSDTKKANKYFELLVRRRVDRCPSCRNKAHPESLIYCSENDEHYHPDLLDVEMIKYTPMYTHAECDGCVYSRTPFLYNYEQCPYSSIRYVYQCDKCATIFDPDTKEIIRNFADSHALWIE